MKVVCIVGTGHCGSTLLGLLLSKHPEIVSIGEFHSFNEQRSRTDRGVHPTEDPKYATVAHLVPSHNFQIYRRKLDVLLGKPNYCYVKSSQPVIPNDYYAWHAQAYDEILRIAGDKETIVYSGPVEHAALLNESPDFDVVVVHLVRNRSAVVWSYMRKYGHPLTQLWRYIGVNMKVLLYTRRRNLNTIFLNYELLAKHPDTTMQALFIAMGIKADDTVMEQPINGQFMVGGNGMRHTENLEVKMDYRYQKEMPLLWLYLSSWLLWPVQVLFRPIYKLLPGNTVI